MAQNYEYSRKIWQRGKNSHATTIPSEIMAIKNAPTGDGAETRWSINPDTGNVEVEFVEANE